MFAIRSLRRSVAACFFTLLLSFALGLGLSNQTYAGTAKVKTAAKGKTPAKGTKKAPAKKHHKKKKSPHKLTIGAQAGAGFDSNTFNKPSGNESQAMNETAAVKAKYSFKVSKRVKFKLGAGANDTYRLAGGNAKALKLGIKGVAGVEWKVFGAKSTKKHFKQNGKLAFNIGYSGTFNPTLVPAPSPRAAGFVDADGDGIDDADADGIDDENVDIIDEDDEIDDASLEDDLSGGEDDTFADEGDDSEDEEDEEDSGDFFEEDPVGNQFFNSKPPRHNFTGALSFTYQAFKKTKFVFGGQGSINDVGETPGRVTSDAMGAGGSLKFEHVFNKVISLNGGYNLAFKQFNSKTTAAGDTLKMVAHGLGVGAKFKPIKKLKIVTGYRMGYTTVPPNTANNSLFHQARLGFDYKILKGLSFFWENNAMFSGRTANSLKDAKRYQTLLGLRGCLDFPHAKAKGKKHKKG